MSFIFQLKFVDTFKTIFIITNNFKFLNFFDVVGTISCDIFFFF